MRLFKRSACVCAQNFRKWGANYRIWIIVIFAIIFTQEMTAPVLSFSRQLGIPVSPWIFPFLYGQGYVKLLFFFPLLLLYCDAPFVDENQPYIIARSGRTAWALGEIGYIVVSSALYFLFLLLLSMMMLLPNLQYTDDWGKVLGTLSKTSAYTVLGNKIFISSQIIDYFTPPQAMWFTFFLSWLAGIFLGLLVYMLNSLTNTRVLGVLAASFFLVLDAAAKGPNPLRWFSPVSWCALDRIDIGGVSQNPTITYIYLAFAVLILLLAGVSVFANRKQTIQVLPPV